MNRRIVRIASPLLLATAQAACAEACGLCLGGSTWISLRRGRKRLKDVQVGDLVQSFDVTTGEVVERPVLRVFEHGPSPVGELLSGAGDGARNITGNHPVFVEATGEFIPARELDRQHQRRRGLYWDDRDLRSIALDPFGHAPKDQVLEVYNLSIEGTETYFADGLLVHNKSSGDCEYEPDYCYSGDGGAGGLGGASSGGQSPGIGGTIGTGGAAGGGAVSTSGAAGEGGVAGAAGGTP